MAAISIGSSASGAAAASSNASRTKNFDSVMSGVGHRPREADTPSNDDTRVAARDDRDDDDRKDKKNDRPRDKGEDPTALLALANSVAAITRNDASAADAAKAAVDKAATTAAAATAALTPAATPADATAQPAQPAPAPIPPDPNALSAAFAAQAQTAQPPAAKPTQKIAFGAASLSTADILASRTATVAAAAAMQGDSKDAADADANADGRDTPKSLDPALALGTTPAASSIAVTTTIGAPSGGELLATGATDRRLDLAKGDAWLDGLARDIASTADSGGKLNFQLSPPALGNLNVELTRGDDGTAVKMTAATIDAQAILADAKPRLIEAARAHGVHISDATIDLGGAGTATTGGQHRDSSGDFSGNSGASSGQFGANSAGTGGDANQQAQSQAQSEPDLYHVARRPGTIAGAPTGGSRRDLDAGYA